MAVHQKGPGPAAARLPAARPPAADPQVVTLRREADPLQRYRMAVAKLAELRALAAEVDTVRAEAAAEMADRPMILADVGKLIGLSIAQASRLVRKGERSLKDSGAW